MGHANIQVRRADHVGFAVASLDESPRFWVDGRGARLVRTQAYGGTGVLKAIAQIAKAS